MFQILLFLFVCAAVSVAAMSAFYCVLTFIDRVITPKYTAFAVFPAFIIAIWVVLLVFQMLIIGYLN